MGNIEDYNLRKIINDYVKEVCHYSQKQVFANSKYQKNYFQSQIDETIDGLIKFLQLYYNSDNRRQQMSWAQEERIPTEQQIESVIVLQNNILDNLENQPENQPGIQPENQPEIQPEIQPEGQQGILPEGQTGSLPESSNEAEGRVFTVEELSQYNGMNQNPAYVAVNGVVYDVSSIGRWAGGSHFGLTAGQDQTRNFMGCHLGNSDRLQMLPVVGTLLSS